MQSSVLQCMVLRSSAVLCLLCGFMYPCTPPPPPPPPLGREPSYGCGPPAAGDQCVLGRIFQRGGDFQGARSISAIQAKLKLQTCNWHQTGHGKSGPNMRPLLLVLCYTDSLVLLTMVELNACRNPTFCLHGALALALLRPYPCDVTYTLTLHLGST